MTELETVGPDEAPAPEEHEHDGAAGSNESPDAVDDGAQPAGELTEAQLEALLFVAEKPLSRREIGRWRASTGRPSTRGSGTSRCRWRDGGSG